tara:strand:+ start:1359 stop:2288 length:930 start_codon:yes stop_codon:yes gene_type:complete
MGFGLHKILSSISVRASILLFNQRLALGYIFYNFIFRLFIANKKSHNPDIINFHENGYTKLNINVKDELNKFLGKIQINEETTKKSNNVRNKRIHFTIPDIDKLELYKDLKIKLSPILNDLSDYYGSEIELAEIKLFRIKNENIGKDLNKDVYSNNFHQDGYIMNYIKLGINLMDITENDGPMEIVNIKDRKKFVKSFKYKGRNDYNVDGDKNLVYKNTGKLGDCFLFSSSQCFHKAGEPSNYRDMIMMILVASTKNKKDQFNINNKLEVFNPTHSNQNQEIIQLTKPYGFINILKIFFGHFKENFKKG